VEGLYRKGFSLGESLQAFAAEPDEGSVSSRNRLPLSLRPASFVVLLFERHGGRKCVSSKPGFRH
jgi:hypothetical protein